MTESFRDTNKKASSASEDFDFDVKNNTAEREPFDFETGRSTAEGSPSAIVAGLILHSSKAMAKQLKPISFNCMDPVVAIALQCDLTGSDTEIKARMKNAGLTDAEICNLWAVSERSYRAARKREIGKRIKMKAADADLVAFNAAHTELIGFMKDAEPSENEGESFR